MKAIATNDTLTSTTWLKSSYHSKLTKSLLHKLFDFSRDQVEPGHEVLEAPPYDDCKGVQNISTQLAAFFRC